MTDRPAVERLGAEKVDEIEAIEVRAYPHPWSARILRDTFRHGTPCWGIRDDAGPLIAYAFCSIAVGEAQVLNITVDPDRQGQGWGRYLMEFLLHKAREELCTTVLLEVRRSNTPARRLYESLGFNTLGVRKGYYPNGSGQTEDALVMGYEIV